MYRLATSLLLAVSMLPASALAQAGGTVAGSAYAPVAPAPATTPSTAAERAPAGTRRWRLDIGPGFGLVHRETERGAQDAVAFQIGGRWLPDGENGGFLDVGFSLTMSSGRGLFYSGEPSSLWVGFARPTFSASGLVEGGYLHRFVLDGTVRHGLALDLGLGASGVWIGAQISPGATGLVTIDWRAGAFFIGLDVRARAIAWFYTGGSAIAMGDAQVLLRIGFGFGG